MTIKRDKPTANTVITGELAQDGTWVVACVEPQIPWPTSVQRLVYRDQTIFVLPQFDDFYPSVVLRLGNGINTFEDAQVLILNLLSAMCWVDGKGAVVRYWTGGNLPKPMGGFSRSGIGIVLTENFQHHYLPDVTDQNARWALAFYREGLSIRQTPYAFLSFYKIINILHNSGAKQKAWINDHVDAAAKHDSMERLQVLRKSYTDVGQYLYESGRCAVAHAGQGPTIDPENPDDLKRLAQDLPLIRDLAAYAIEFELGVKSSQTIYQEHLYELEGFRSLAGEFLCRKLKGRENVKPEEFPALPPLHVGLHGEEDCPPLCNLAARVAAIEEGIVYIECISSNGRTRMMLGLDFPNERLLTCTIDGLVSLDDGSEAAIHDAIAVMAFKKAYFANGELIVKRADTDERMGRCDPFIPVNVDIVGTLRNFDAITDQLRNLAKERATISAN